MTPPSLSPQTEESAALEALGHLAKSELTGQVPADAEVRGRRRFMARLPREGGRRATRRVVLGASVAAATLLAVLLISWIGRRPALTYEVDAPIALPGDYLLVPNDAREAHVLFSDGSKLTLGSGGRARIVKLSADGAEIGLEEGKATFEVTHRPATRWSVAAGPFAIVVTGTAFDVRWSGAERIFELQLQSGSVTVQGPLAAPGIVLGAGQRLVADLGAGALHIERLPTAAPESRSIATSQESTPSEPQVADSLPQGRSASSSGASDGEGRPSSLRREALKQTEPSWTERVAAGDFRGVLAAAEERGLQTALDKSALSDLVALADAARYVGRVEVARRALLAQRERFGGSDAAKTAAFLLGRLADTGEAPPAAALGWYDRYFVEAPSGEFAAEALGRKLTALERSSGPAAARRAAAEYLRRFPKGPYAEKARALTLAP